MNQLESELAAKFEELNQNDHIIEFKIDLFLSQKKPNTDTPNELKDILKTIKDYKILVVGETGAGKSSLIKQMTKLSVPIGHTMESCTTKLTPYSMGKFSWYDTPGWADTSGRTQHFIQIMYEGLKKLKYFTHVFLLMSEKVRFNEYDQEIIKNYLTFLGVKPFHTIYIIYSGVLDEVQKKTYTDILTKILNMYQVGFKILENDQSDMVTELLFDEIKNNVQLFDTSNFVEIKTRQKELQDLKEKYDKQGLELKKIKTEQGNNIKRVEIIQGTIKQKIVELNEQRKGLVEKMKEELSTEVIDEYEQKIKEVDNEILRLIEYQDNKTMELENANKNLFDKLNELLATQNKLLESYKSVQSSRNDYVMSDRCGAMTQKGLPCRNGINCPHH
jgi:GTP-binding protein EngB required for normal cell division